MTELRSRGLSGLHVLRYRRMTKSMLLAGVLMAVAGCDQLGIETPQKTAERQLAEAKAVGGACRHALRAIEDCYTLNPKSDKSAVYDGWREMDEYMRENKLEGIVPVVPRPAPSAPAAKASAPDDEEDSATDAPEDGAKGNGKGEAKAAKANKGHSKGS